MARTPRASAPAGVDVKVVKLGVGGGGAESIQTKEVNSEPSLKWRPEGVDMVALGGENLGSHLKPPKKTLFAKGGRRGVLLDARGSGSWGPSPFPFCLHASLGVEDGCSGAEPVQPLGLQRASGGGMVLGRHSPHKQATNIRVHATPLQPLPSP